MQFDRYQRRSDSFDWIRQYQFFLINIQVELLFCCLCDLFGRDGTKQLSDGSDQVKDGIKELNDGAKELNKGQKKFYKEGIKKLDDTVNKDLQEVLDRFEAIQSDDVLYTTFTDKSSDMDGNVKFIFESDPIEVSDDEK